MVFSCLYFFVQNFSYFFAFVTLFAKIIFQKMREAADRSAEVGSVDVDSSLERRRRRRRHCRLRCR